MPFSGDLESCLDNSSRKAASLDSGMKKKRCENRENTGPFRGMFLEKWSFLTKHTACHMINTVSLYQTTTDCCGDGLKPKNDQYHLICVLTKVAGKSEAERYSRASVLPSESCAAPRRDGVSAKQISQTPWPCAFDSVSAQFFDPSSKCGL